jgi:hypothetical protein
MDFGRRDGARRQRRIGSIHRDRLKSEQPRCQWARYKLGDLRSAAYCGQSEHTTQTDNYSTRGNVNPNNGTVGTRTPRY